MFKKRRLNDNECKSVWTLNTWTDEKLNEVEDLLKKGYYVHMGSSAIGLTRAQITENWGINWALRKYGLKRLDVIEREGWGSRSSYWLHLKKK